MINDRFSHSAEPVVGAIPPQDEKRANSLKNAPSEVQTNLTADALDCFWNASLGAAVEKQDSLAFAIVGCIAEGVKAIAQHLRESEAPSHKAIDAERAWEIAMMAAIGEDGIGSVTEAIMKLKAENDAAAIANEVLKQSADGLRRDLTSTQTKLRRCRHVCDLLHRLLTAVHSYSNSGFLGRAKALREIRKIEAEIDALPPYQEGDAT